MVGGSLIAFRVLQGLGGGLVMPVGMTILARAAGPERMGRVMALVGVPMLLAPALGPALGGALIDGVSWRLIFFVNLPIGIVALVLAARVLPREATSPSSRLDVRGLALLSPGLALLVAGLTGLIPALVPGVLLIAAFIFHATRTDDPLIDLRIFRDRVRRRLRRHDAAVRRRVLRLAVAARPVVPACTRPQRARPDWCSACRASARC